MWNATGWTVRLTAIRWRYSRRLFLPVRPTSSRPTKRRHNAYVPESIVDVVWELRDLESTRASTYKWKIRSGSTDAQRQTTAVHLVHIVSVEIFDSITYVI